MKRLIVRYKVKADKAQENINYVKNVFKGLNETAPAGLRYATFIQPDGVSFIHIASIETKDGNNPLSESPAFGEFQKDIKDRCEIPPQPVELKEIGSYNFFKEN